MAWYEKSFRRNLVDMHIDGWDPAFLSQFDPEAYCECLKEAKIQTPMIYLHSHVGWCNWQTKSGETHPAFAHEDKIRRLVDLCHEAGMTVVGYYSLIYNNRAYERHPDWRMLNKDGFGVRDAAWKQSPSQRHGLVCPNQMAYREFLKAQFAELVEAYPVEGLFLDMTFWPMVCYCPACRERYRRETGKEIPETVDWFNEDWKLFQERRTAWMGEFARFCTEELHRLRPDLAVEHQFSTMHQYWQYGVDGAVGDASEYAGGDLYGGPEQQSYICKFFREQTRHQPFEYMTSRCDPRLSEHTTTKTYEDLRLHNLLTVAHHGACLFIDAIDPVGTLDRRVYQRIGRVFEESIPYEPFYEGQLMAQTGLLFSFESKLDRTVKAPAEAQKWENAQLDAQVGASIALGRLHRPYTVFTFDHLERLKDMKAVCLSQACFLKDEHVAALKAYVENGGCLYMSGDTDEKLAHALLGLRYKGFTEERVTYLAPTDRGQFLFPEHDARHPLSHQRPQMRAENPQGHPVLATVCLPYTDPAKPATFASIHSNPPGILTEEPALIAARVGKGTVIWCSASIETNQQSAHQAVFANVIRLLQGENTLWRTDALPQVEVVGFDCGACRRISFVSRLPVAAPDFAFTLLGDWKEAVLLPEGTPLPARRDRDGLTVTVSGLDPFAMVEFR